MASCYIILHKCMFEDEDLSACSLLETSAQQLSKVTAPCCFCSSVTQLFYQLKIGNFAWQKKFFNPTDPSRFLVHLCMCLWTLWFSSWCVLPHWKLAIQSVALSLWSGWSQGFGRSGNQHGAGMFPLGAGPGGGLPPAGHGPQWDQAFDWWARICPFDPKSLWWEILWDI